MCRHGQRRKAAMYISSRLAPLHRYVSVFPMQKSITIIVRGPVYFVGGELP